MPKGESVNICCGNLNPFYFANNQL